ncbi:MAG: cupin domain-containing protein [Candidatus Latescibacterota bacterium]
MKSVSDGLFCWSVFHEVRQLDFNGHLWVRAEGNVLVDPVPMIESDLAQLDSLGGAAVIVVTNRDHQREAAAFRERTGARIVAYASDAPLLECAVDDRLADGDEVVPGLIAVHMGAGGKSPGEIALYWPDRGMVLAGDLVVGAPVGRLSLLMDDKLEDPAAAALACRKLLALDFDTMLVGDGHSIVGGAREHLLRCLEARTDIYINRIKAGDVPWTSRRDRDGYECDSREIDALIGARRLGYRLIRLPPGQSSCPFHLHHKTEELFVVTEGECTLRTDRGEWSVTAGDYIAFPTGPTGVHKFSNNSSADCVLLAVGEQLDDDVCEYPDSDKVNVLALPGERIFRRPDGVGYWEGE